MKEQSRTPGKHPNTTKDNIVEGILNLKKKYPRWGAKKIRILLFNDFTKQETPSVVTVHNILKKKKTILRY